MFYSHSPIAPAGRGSRAISQDPGNSDDEYVGLFDDDEQGGGSDDEHEEDIDHRLVVSLNLRLRPISTDWMPKNHAGSTVVDAEHKRCPAICYAEGPPCPG